MLTYMVKFLQDVVKDLEMRKLSWISQIDSKCHYKCPCDGIRVKLRKIIDTEEEEEIATKGVETEVMQLIGM